MDNSDTTVTIRLPKALRDKLAMLAEQDFRTLSAEIRYLVELAIRNRETNNR